MKSNFPMTLVFGIALTNETLLSSLRRNPREEKKRTSFMVNKLICFLFALLRLGPFDTKINGNKS